MRALRQTKLSLHASLVYRLDVLRKLKLQQVYGGVSHMDACISALRGALSPSLFDGQRTWPLKDPLSHIRPQPQSFMSMICARSAPSMNSFTIGPRSVSWPLQGPFQDLKSRSGSSAAEWLRFSNDLTLTYGIEKSL